MKAAAAEPCRGCRYLAICGQLVCGRGFMKMMGIGKRRFNTLGKAVRSGEQFCPYDTRYIKRGPDTPSEKYKKVYDYLMEMYTNVAEVIPDGLNSNKRPRHGKGKIDSRNMDRKKIKHLPPASISDYHRQCQAAAKDTSISRKLFCTVSCLNLLGQKFCLLSFSVFAYYVVPIPEPFLL